MNRMRALALGVACGSVLGCTRGATQLVVAVESDLLLADRACVHAEVVRVGQPDASESFFYATGSRSPRGEIPFSFGVTAPGGDASGRVEIRVSAVREGESCRTDTLAPSDVVVTRRVRTGFIAGHTLLVPVFLSSACVGVTCGADETCEAGMCVPAEVDPATLRRITPGEELADAGRRDAGSEAIDAGSPTDAGPIVTGFSPTLTAPSYALELMGSQPAYPVGVAGADRVVVAGYATSALSLGASTVPAGSMWLASLSPTGVPDWVTTSPAVSYPWPQVRRVVPYADGFVACLSVNGSVTLGEAAACSARPCVVLARLDRGGAPTAVRRIDAPAGEIWCSDLEVVGNRAIVGARTFEVTALELDDTPTTPAGTLDGASQNILRAVIDDVAGAFDVTETTVVGHNPSTFGVMFGYPGSPLLVRGDGAGGEVAATTAQALSRTGASPGGTVALRIARADAAGAERWAVPSLVSLSSGAGLALHGMSVSAGVVWLAVTVSTSTAGERATFLGLPAITIDRSTALLVALDLETGTARSATDVGIGTPAGGEDTFISSPISHMLQGGAVAATGAGDALFAGALATSDTIGGVSPTVMGESDALVGIVGPDGAVRATWQWSARTELDARLTHVEWMPGGWVAVGGYVEDDADTWRRSGSFLLIHPAM